MPKNTLWILVAIAALILLITSGVRLSLGLFVQPITEDTAVSIVEISFALAMTQLMWGVSQPITGAIADRFGAWWVLLFGTLMLIGGLLLVPQLLSVWGLTLTLGVLIAFGAGAGSFSVLMGQVANQVPERMRGTASGVINAGSSFGQFLFAPMLQLLISLPLIGWMGSFYVLAAVCALCIPLAWYLTTNTRHTAKINNQSTQSEAAAAESLGATLKKALVDKNYLLLNLAFFTCGFHIAFLVTHLPTEVTLAGLSADVASWSLALIGLSNVVGSLIVGWSVGHWRCKYILFWMYLSRVVLIAIFVLAPANELTFYLFAIGLGLTWLATVPPTAGAIGKLFGVRYLATLFGLALLSHQIGGFLGAYFGGIAITAFGSYTYMWYADMALALLAAVSNLPIDEPKVAKPA